jgi:hypothetical protein
LVPRKTYGWRWGARVRSAPPTNTS